MVENSTIEFIRGESVSIKLTLRNIDQSIPDITSDLFEAQIKDAEDESQVLATCSIVKDIPNGFVYCELTPAQSILIPYTVALTSKGAVAGTPECILLFDCFRTAGTDRKCIARSIITVHRTSTPPAA